MLRSLLVKNYAIIDQLEIKFSDKLTIITGETGAGKSILLGALSLILGNRADSNSLYDPEKKCVVEGIFDIEGYNLKEFFEKEDLDFESTTIIRREINAKGKSRAFINDTPVNLSILKKVSTKLIDIHAQHETLDLKQDDFQLFILDALAGNEAILTEYKNKYRSYRRNLKKLEELEERNQQANKDLDYYQFQLEEFELASLNEHQEQELLEDELNTLTNAEEIKLNLVQSVQLLEEDEFSVLSQLNNLSTKFSGISKINGDLQNIYDRIESARIELKDISKEIQYAEQHVTFDEERIQEITERLNLIYKLQKKHQVNTIEGLLSIQNELSEKVKSIADLSDEIQQLEQQIKSQLDDLKNLATTLSKNRKVAAAPFEKDVNNLLAEVGMPNAQVKVHIEKGKEDQLNNNGIDAVTLLFSANPGGAMAPVSKVASGGELSRLMLMIKSLVAGSTSLPTIVFDEIDAGISGETGVKVGKILEKLSKQHQVLCITHLPQIASKGNSHYYVYKEISGQKTFTRIKQLEKDERVIEIAKMLSGEKPSTAAVENAKELLSQ